MSADGVDVFRCATDRIDADDFLATLTCQPVDKSWHLRRAPSDRTTRMAGDQSSAVCSAAWRLNTTPMGRVSSTSMGSVDTLASAYPRLARASLSAIGKRSPASV